MDEELIRGQIEALGISVGAVHRNLPSPELTARSLARGEGILAANGALVVTTGPRTGRSPADKFIVADAAAGDVDWGDVNHACSAELFDRLLRKASGYLHEREVYVFDGFVGAEAAYRLPVRVLAEASWHALFAQTLLVRPTASDLARFVPEFTVIACGRLLADPATDGTRSPVFVGISFSRRIVLIIGTMYAGEIKKALFTVMNYLLPVRDVLPMHCSATVGRDGDVALFFGLSGTGKTTLSADPARRLVGDDEHGWSDHGIFNFEGGCYAKVIRLSPRDEPQIYAAIRFGSLLENVVVDPLTRAVAWDDDSISENTRATYPLDHIPDAIVSGVVGAPANVFFLTCDAYGVLPPIAKLTPAMASYHFLSGFTARVGGTEAGVAVPEPTFSACFGAPFMPRDPVVYATMLATRLAAAKAQCWLVNTGWSGGAYGSGERMPIALTRQLITAALDGSLAGGSFTPDPVFGVLVPTACPGVSAQVLEARASWADPAAYDRQAAAVAQRFAGNFARFQSRVPADVAAAGPVAGS